jgi:hypothetical protein
MNETHFSFLHDWGLLDGMDAPLLQTKLYIPTWVQVAVLSLLGPTAIINVIILWRR